MKVRRTLTAAFLWRRPAATLAALALAGCATMGATGGATDGATTTTGSGVSPDATWPTSTREHVDLWLHGYALLTADTARVPFFRRGYKERMRTLKGQRNVYTQLDANAENLSARFRVNPALVNGQFVPLYFSSFEQIQQTVEAFLRAGGDPRAASDAATQQYFALLANSFPEAADRDWLRLFVQSLADERNRFYHDYWTAEQATRTAARDAVDTLWQRHVRPAIQRLLNNTQQNNGELILSLPLDGEGRTVQFSRTQNAVAVAFPETPASAWDALFVFAHEAVNPVTGPAIADNITPAEQRAGASGRFAANANVRAGALVMQRVAPQISAEYMRYYLRSAGLAAPAGDPTSAFNAAFAIPDAIRDAIVRQLDVVFGGI